MSGAIQACILCALACDECAAACIRHGTQEMVDCALACLDCADACRSTAPRRWHAGSTAMPAFANCAPNFAVNARHFVPGTPPITSIASHAVTRAKPARINALHTQWKQLNESRPRWAPMNTVRIIRVADGASAPRNATKTGDAWKLR